MDVVVEGHHGDIGKARRDFAPDGLDAALVLAGGDQKAFGRLNELIEAGPFPLEVGHLYSMEEAARAQQEALEHHVGKFALRIH